ncbi:hypothetical protein ES705_07754 [subsurface metagenome]
MSKIQYVAIIILIITIVITVVCFIVLPRLYYRKKRKNFTKNPADTNDIITAIYTTSAVQVTAIYATAGVQISLIIGLLGGLIVVLMGLMISLQK